MTLLFWSYWGRRREAGYWLGPLRADEHQACGGARAWKKPSEDRVGAASESSRSRIGLAATGIGNEGASAARAPAAKLVTAQMAQKSKPGRGAFCGIPGLSGTAAGVPSSDNSASATAPPAEPLARPCMCPNDNVNWIASAKIAHHAPYRIFVRNQRMWNQCRGLKIARPQHGISRHGSVNVNAVGTQLNFIMNRSPRPVAFRHSHPNWAGP
jgi:hypothetical protein